MQVSPHVRLTLEQAAELRGVTVNQFIIQSAYQEAERLVERESILRLSQRDARKVFWLIENPPKVNNGLKKAVKRFKETARM